MLIRKKYGKCLGSHCKTMSTQAKTMQAIVVTTHSNNYAQAWKIREVPVPVPNQGEVLVHVHSASLNPLDLWMSRGYGGKLFANQGIAPPYIVGRDGSGTVVSVGSGVWDYKVGDEVIVCPSVFTNNGTFAEYCTSSQFDIAMKPKNVSFAEAAGIPFAALTAWNAVHRVNPGTKVLVYGAGGSVGYFVINFLKNVLGCTVTGVCAERDMAKVSLVCDHVIDYNDDEELEVNKQSKLFDSVIDVASSVSKRLVETQSLNTIRRGGHYITSNAELINKIDEENNLMMGTILGGADLCTKKLRYWRTHGISYEWVFFNPDGRQLINISNWVADRVITLNQVADFPYVDFMKAIEYFQQQGDDDVIPTKKVVLNFVKSLGE